ncbi:hypothetical protein B4N89_45040 [Embleya scabrispora]|uniref:Uncharacterized protein n=1 Tax=Embleya scabrispora TaxID=159449 RepID=A0A1T3NIJ3_9ACTN|nr:hypothetical protein B4N89_45040 [Embleya scabrispora]
MRIRLLQAQQEIMDDEGGVVGNLGVPRSRGESRGTFHGESPLTGEHFFAVGPGNAGIAHVPSGSEVFESR